jgi:hypothetical protein
MNFELGITETSEFSISNLLFVVIRYIFLTSPRQPLVPITQNLLKVEANNEFLLLLCMQCKVLHKNLASIALQLPLRRLLRSTYRSEEVDVK